jgi:hypothetical protein
MFLCPIQAWSIVVARIAVFIGAKSFRRGQTAIGLGHRIVNRRMYPADTVAISDPLPTARAGFTRCTRLHAGHSMDS